MIDLVIDGNSEIMAVLQKDGTTINQLVLQPERLYWATRMIDANTFSRLALEIKNLYRKGQECFYNMAVSEANIIFQQVVSIIESYKTAIDAKSSESKLNNQNNKPTLLDKVGRNRIERVYSTGDEMKQGIWASFMGDKQRDSN